MTEDFWTIFGYTEWAFKVGSLTWQGTDSGVGRLELGPESPEVGSDSCRELGGQLDEVENFASGHFSLSLIKNS